MSRQRHQRYVISVVPNCRVVCPKGQLPGTTLSVDLTSTHHVRYLSRLYFEEDAQHNLELVTIMDPSSASFLANALGQIKTSAANATSNFSTSDLLMFVPRILARAGGLAFITFPEQIDGMLGYQNSGSVIAEATEEGAPTINALLQSNVPSQEATTAWIPDTFAIVDGGNSSSLHQSWSFSHVRNFGGIFTYVTSKWAVACLTLV